MMYNRKAWTTFTARNIVDGDEKHFEVNQITVWEFETGAIAWTGSYREYDHNIPKTERPWPGFIKHRKYTSLDVAPIELVVKVHAVYPHLSNADIMPPRVRME